MVMKVFHKISDETRRKAFLQEIKLLRTIAHPADRTKLGRVKKVPFCCSGVPSSERKTFNSVKWNSIG